MQHGLKRKKERAGSRETQRGKWKRDKVEEAKIRVGEGVNM